VKTLRTTLADSHVAAIAIAVLLFGSLESACWALWVPLPAAVSFLLDVATIRNVPYSATAFDRVSVLVATSWLFYSLAYFAAAELLSRWVYGMGPLRSLSRYRTRLVRRNHA
jgi:hypothetical protein